MSFQGIQLALVITLSTWCVPAIVGDDWQPFQPGAAEYYAAGSERAVQPAIGAEPNLILDHGYGDHGGVVAPVSGIYPHQQHGGDQCEVYKVGFTQDLYFQYVLYKTDVPDLKEFTLCFWTKFYNHSNDHPVFSYAVNGQPKAILSAVSNTDRSSYFTMAVAGHTFYRLNYPLRLNKWYHTCQSWNGKTGEWQIWVNAERVGRGFHNRLVGHTVPGGGIAITGQEQAQLGGGFQEGKYAPKGSGGMLGEITMVQLYSVALTAGKAHKDHKHHHAHQYDHEGRAITTPAPPTPRSRATLPMHPLLTGGQINRKIRINLAQPETIPGQNYDVQLVNGQFVVNHVAQQYQPKRRMEAIGEEQQVVAAPVPDVSSSSSSEENSSGGGSFSTQYFTLGDTPVINSDFSHQDVSIETHNLFKRHNEDESSQKVVKKREYVFVEPPVPASHQITFEQSLLDGLAGIGQNSAISEKQKQSEDEREPAEAEVKAVLNICDGCDAEPFERALVFGWRTVPKKLYSGAFYKPAKPQCKVF